MITLPARARTEARRRGGASAAAALVILLFTSACAPGLHNSGVGANQSEPVSTDIASTKVTLKLYDGQGLKALDEALISAFHKKFPNITITGTYDPDNVTSQNQPRQLSSATPPDLARVISVTDGTKNGLLTNLDPYAAAYGWTNLPPSQLAQYREYNNVSGSGSLYAKPTGFTMTGLYYNKKLATQIGMTAPPKSITALTTLMAKAKADGLIPLAAGNSAGTTVIALQLLLNSFMGARPVSQWVFTSPGARIDTPAGVKAATVLDGWVKSGFLPKGVNGLDPTAATGLFTSGKAVFYAWGNWEAPTMDKALPGQVGFMTMPPATPGGPVAATSDAATAFGIPSKSKHKDAAAAFLNFLSSDQGRQVALDNGFMPSGTADQTPPKAKAGSVLVEIQAAFNLVSAAGGQVPFVQNATAGIANRAWNPESQFLLAGKKSPQQFLASVQAEYENELKTK